MTTVKNVIIALSKLPENTVVLKFEMAIRGATFNQVDAATKSHNIANRKEGEYK